MGLLSSVFSAEKEESSQQLPSLCDEQPNKEEKQYRERITIEWEDRSRSNEVYEDMSDYTSTYWKGFFVLNYRDADHTVRKRLMIPIHNIHRVTLEDIEVK